MKERDFRLIWFASVFSDLGTWMQISALAIFITESTGQATWTGIASTVTYLTAGLFTPIGGVLADRYDRRRLIIVSSLIELTIGLALAACFANGWHAPLLLISIAGAQGVVAAAVVPTLSAMAPDLVSKERTAHAAILEAISWNAGRALGPVIAVAVVSVQSYSTVFTINALSYAAIAIALYAVKARPPRHSEGGGLTSRFTVGWRGLRTNNICFWATVVATVEISLIAPFIALIPVMGQLTLHGDSSASGLLYFGQGAGSAVGVVIIGSLLHRFGVGRLFVATVAVLPMLLAAYAFSLNLSFAMIIIVPLSAAHAVVLALAIAFMQRFADDSVRGRVMGLHRAITISCYAIASAVLAVIASHVGLRPTLLTLSVLTTGVLLWITVAHRADVEKLAAIESSMPTPTEADPLSEEFIPNKTDGFATVTRHVQPTRE